MLRGYITNLGKYNEGQLVGEWIEFPITEDELQEVYKRIGISDEPDEDGNYYEEIFFTDWENDEGLDLELGEYENIEDVNEIAEILDGDDATIIKAIVEATGYDVRTAAGMTDRCTFYEGMELIDVAYEIVSECYDLPEIAERYFDYEAFARDLGFDGYTETEHGTIYIG